MMTTGCIISPLAWPAKRMYHDPLPLSRAISPKSYLEYKQIGRRLPAAEAEVIEHLDSGPQVPEDTE